MSEVRGDDQRQTEEDPERVAADMAEARLEFSNDLRHHLQWMKRRSPGTHLEEAKQLRGVLDVYIESGGESLG